jgi:hypothetical protein
MPHVLFNFPLSRFLFATYNFNDGRLFTPEILVDPVDWNDTQCCRNILRHTDGVLKQHHLHSCIVGIFLPMVEILLQLHRQAVLTSGACNTVALQTDIVHHMVAREVIVCSEMGWRSKNLLLWNRVRLDSLNSIYDFDVAVVSSINNKLI